jgi:hypothetical protein
VDLLAVVDAPPAQRFVHKARMTALSVYANLLSRPFLVCFVIQVSGRRVLADLEWWSVVDGQLNSDASLTGRRLYADENVVPQDRPSTPAVDQSSSEVLGLSPARFAAMSLGPRTPPRITRHASDSSVRSLESTPEVDELPLLELHRCYDDEEEDAEEDDFIVDLFLVSPETSTVSTAKRSPSQTPRRRALGRSYSSSYPYPATSPTNRKRAAGPKSWFPRDDYADFTVSPLSSHAPDLYD